MPFSVWVQKPTSNKTPPPEPPVNNDCKYQVKQNTGAYQCMTEQEYQSYIESKEFKFPETPTLSKKDAIIEVYFYFFIIIVIFVVILWSNFKKPISKNTSNS